MDLLLELRSEANELEAGYRRWDDMAVELETAEFLHALIRLLKPRLVLETGTGRGYASAFIASALAENGFGRLVTYEPLPRFAEEARARLAGLPVEVRDGDASSFDGAPDLVFLDSAPPFREWEIRHWEAQEVVLVVHDAGRYALPGGVRLPTPRGLWFRATNLSDEGR